MNHLEKCQRTKNNFILHTEVQFLRTRLRLHDIYLCSKKKDNISFARYLFFFSVSRKKSQLSSLVMLFREKCFLWTYLLRTPCNKKASGKAKINWRRTVVNFSLLRREKIFAQVISEDYCDSKLYHVSEALQEIFSGQWLCLFPLFSSWFFSRFFHDVSPTQQITLAKWSCIGIPTLFYYSDDPC